MSESKSMTTTIQNVARMRCPNCGAEQDISRYDIMHYDKPYAHWTCCICRYVNRLHPITPKNIKKTKD